MGVMSPSATAWTSAAFAALASAAVSSGGVGFGLRALREDETAAETIGVPVVRYKLLAFTLSGIIPALVGATMQMRSGYFEPLAAFDPLVSLTMICIAVIGGSDRPLGPVLGTLLLVGLSEMLWARFPLFYMVILGMLLLVFVLAVPHGLAGYATRLLAALRQTPSRPAAERQ